METKKEVVPINFNLEIWRSNEKLPEIPFRKRKSRPILVWTGGLWGKIHYGYLFRMSKKRLVWVAEEYNEQTCEYEFAQPDKIIRTFDTNGTYWSYAPTEYEIPVFANGEEW